MVFHVVLLLYAKTCEGVPGMAEVEFDRLRRTGCLAGVSGELRRGRVTAVLGPSGAGKTSFFSVLSGRLAPTGGTVLLDGHRTSLGQHKSLLGFVTEEDPLLPLFSVEETLDFAAAVRLSPAVTPHERARLVSRLLNVLGLSHLRQSRVGQGAALAGVRGVSFGERRRLSIGVELVGLPQILFVDDATCGLDSRTAREIVATLGRVAANNLTVAAILHQPSWALLSRIDDVLCIGRGGHGVYCGPSGEALGYFASASFACPSELSPTVFLLELLAGQPPAESSPADAGDAAADSTDSVKAVRGVGGGEAAPQRLLSALAALWQLQYDATRPERGAALPLPVPRQPPRFVAQLRLYTRRACVLLARRWRKTTLDYALMALVGATAGFANVHSRFVGPLPTELRARCAENFAAQLHGNQRDAIVHACSSNVLDRVDTAAEYLSVTLSLLAFAVHANDFTGAELRAQRSDAVPRKQALALFLGTDLAGLPWAVLSPACFMLPYWSLVPLRVVWQRWYCTVVLLLWAYAPGAYILTMLLGYYRAFPAGVVVCTGMVIFDGINLPPRMWGPLSFVPYLSINRWAIENMYLGVVDNYAHKYDLRPVLDEYEFVQGRQATAYAAMAALGLFWRLVAFGCLLAQRRTKK